MKNKLILAALILLSFLLQCTVLQTFAIGSISANLLVILCVSMGLLRGKKTGMFTGFSVESWWICFMARCSGYMR